MPAKLSAGLLLFRRKGDTDVEILIAHMGGPFWAKKDAGAWSIPKGEYSSGEEPLEAARREFAEEIGQEPPGGEPIPLGEVKQSSSKRICAWAIEGDLDVTDVRSNTFEMEWPPKSGRLQAFPEIDRADWFDVRTASAKLVRAHVPFLGSLTEQLGLAHRRDR
jgi:predicted NUDIX family NTP pyrophosphohydrolase